MCSRSGTGSSSILFPLPLLLSSPLWSALVDVLAPAVLDNVEGEVRPSRVASRELVELATGCREDDAVAVAVAVAVAGAVTVAGAGAEVEAEAVGLSALFSRGFLSGDGVYPFLGTQ
mgnify:CR=1 FL=1